jgi:iron complex outermembrane receptor protein
MNTFKIFIFGIAGFIGLNGFSQDLSDSTAQQEIDEVIVVGKTNRSNKQAKVLGSLDSYLESNASINMIRRGAYAWEAMLNGMSTERSIVTIDGMRVFGACTDKMDPITSYVETTNLKSASIQSGQAGSQHGATIAGSINLEREHSSFDQQGFSGTLFSGLETNNLQKILGGKVGYSGKRFFADVDYTFREAENYKAGKRQEILYSQFRKQNMSANLGVKLNEQHGLVLTSIYDRATNVGYPALPMDVSLAEAIISSIQHEYHNPEKKLSHWETKLYYNQVTHIMDDSQRPDVPIRMDMPGWTKTAGLYSNVHIHTKKHHIRTGVNGYFNQSIAEMTMYPNNPNEKPMFMFTWPKVETSSANYYLSDEISWTSSWISTFSVGIGINHANIHDTIGLQSLQIFYPEMLATNFRVLPNGGFKTRYEKNRKSVQLGVAYSERAPSVSEAYGFYLFNSNDRYDYIGNPYLKNEQALEFSIDGSIAFSTFILKANANYFHLMNYIIGVQQTDYYPMTIGAAGVKVYEQFDQAHMFNSACMIQYFPIKGLAISIKGSYRAGTAGTYNLPFIQPFNYGGTVKCDIKGYQLETSIEGACKQIKFSPEFGETQAKAYTLWNFGLSKNFQFSKQQLIVKIGVENILDRKYSTFADWNKIPRMGRNIYINLIYHLNFKNTKK